MSEAGQHHFQPQFYLRGFADERGQLRAFDLKTGRELPHTTHVRNVAGERNLYRFGPEEVESDLAAMVDGPAKGTFQRLRQTFPPSAEDRIETSYYLAVLYYRNPTVRELVAQAAGPRFRDEIMAWASTTLLESDETIEQLLRAVEPFNGSREERRALLEEIAAGDYELQLTDALGHIRALGSTAVTDLTCAIHERSWGLGTVAPGMDFLTSDRALAWSSPPGDENRSILNAEYLQFPLDRRTVLGMHRATALGDAQATYSGDLVDETNGLTAAKASRWLYAHPLAPTDIFSCAVSSVN